MRILITGATGFIGSHLCGQLSAEHVVVGTSSRIDVREARACSEFLETVRPEVVYHLAGKTVVGQTLDDSAECFTVNLLGTVNIFEAAKKVGTRRFVHLSTSESYGQQSRPLDDRVVKPQPVTPYGLSKHAAEEYCWMRRGGMEVVRLRGFNTYGPWQSQRAWIPRVVRACLAGEPVISTRGQQTRDYLYVDDMVDGLVRAGVAVRAAECGPINLCTGHEISIAALNELIVKLSESKSEIRLGALAERPCEIERMVGTWAHAREVLQWEPRVRLMDGLRRTIEWFRTKEPS